MTAIPYPTSREKFVLLMALRAILIGAALFLVGLGLLLAAFQIYYNGKVYPGVSVAGVDLTGLKPPAASNRLVQTIDYPQRGRLILQDGQQTWTVAPVELGYFLDSQSSALAAYQVGRTGGLLQRLETQFQVWFNGIDLPPVMVFDQRTGYRYLAEIARQVDRPVLEANLGIQGAEVVVNSGQIGRTTDINATLDLLTIQFKTLQDGLVPLLVRESAPVILDASEQAEIAKRILSDSLTISLPDAQPGDPGPWTFDPPTLATMLAIERVENSQGTNYQIVINTEILRAYLDGLAPSLQRQPVNARYTFNDQTRQLEVIQPAVIGRSLDVEASVHAINQSLITGEHNIPLVMNINKPLAADDTTGEQLGIIELVHSETSYFRGSSTARVQNIKTASSRFHGLVIAPGETFSMAQALGDVSLDTGYAEALIIFGDRTIQGVGGGVCQVSTTLFRGVFFAGFPINERHPHAYRVSYYEQKAGSGINPNFAGLDATVFVPVVDFKFTNDTPHAILMETYVDGYSLTWKFYGTKDNRSVDWKTSGLTNITSPEPPLYRENPSLPQGKIKQVEWATQGADVSIQRTVYLNGSVYIQDQFYTHYLAWREVHEYGPGTEGIPTPEVTPTP
jgi:vancomycin resistance protein YoaR